MSGICPFAVAKIIPPGSNDPRIEPRVAILHVDAGNTYSLYDYFKNRSGGIESHFHVRNDGMIEQYRDIYYQADANHKANDFAVSIETQGYGHGKWNADQLASIKRLLLWLREEAGIPLVECPTWDGAGVGYHTQFGAPGAWTPVAKSCPGPDRIKQYHGELAPWMRKAPTLKQEDDMPNYRDWSPEDRKALADDVAAAVGRAVLDADMNVNEPKGSPRFRGVTLRTALKSIYAQVVPEAGDASPQS